MLNVVSSGCCSALPSLQSVSLLAGSSSNTLTERLLRQNAELTGFVSRLTEEKNDLRNHTLRLEEEVRRYRQAAPGAGDSVSFFSSELLRYLVFFFGCLHVKVAESSLPAVQRQQMGSSIQSRHIRLDVFSGAGGLEQRENPSGKSSASGAGPAGATAGGDQSRNRA